MRFFFVTYCFASPGEEALIGVYKRGLRLALELAGRGHEVVFFCPGRESYRDPLTAAAPSRLTFLDLPELEQASEERQREILRRRLGDLAPDQVVVGEAPLDGEMLEVTLSAVELRIPVTLLDNAYRPGLVDLFMQYVGAVADAAVVTGLSSCHTRHRWPGLCQVAPFVDPRAEAGALLGLRGRRVIVVLAYDEKVERLGVGLLAELDDPEVEAVFIGRRAEGPDDYLDALGEAWRERLRVLEPPDDPTLFSLLALARLAIVKYGFMQVTECLALGTPVIAVFHEGLHWHRQMPPASRELIHDTAASEADGATVEAARRLLRLPPAAMKRVHDGRLDAAARAASFLEALPAGPRGRGVRRNRWAGFAPRHVKKALAALHGQPVEELSLLRFMRLRNVPDCAIFVILCGYRVGGEARHARLWGRRYRSFRAARQDLDQAAGRGRQVLFVSRWRRRAIEVDPGAEALPSILLE